ncbi:MAG: DUF6056 family protein [Bernardetiaceae bacterium]|nr:DUF6056 family protein [Bernardetiaceae bacterium]
MTFRCRALATDPYGWLMVLLAVGNLCLLARLLALGSMLHPAGDDLNFLVLLRQHDFWHAATVPYFFWGGRLGPYVVNCALAQGYLSWGSFLPFYLLFLPAWGWGLYGLLVRLGQRAGWRFPWHRVTLANLTWLLFGVWLLATAEAGAMFWMGSAVTYQGGVLAAIWVAYWLLAPRLHWWHYPLLGLVSAYAGNSAEHFGLAWALLLSIFGLAGAWLRYGGVVASKWRRQLLRAVGPEVIGRVWAAWLGAALGFGVMLASPGNGRRLSYFGGGELANFFRHYRQNVPLFFHDFVPAMLLPCLFLGPVLWYLGTRAQGGAYLREPSPSRQLAGGLGLVLGLILVLLGPLVYATAGVGPERSHAVMAWLLILLVGYFTLRLGQWAPPPRHFALAIALLAAGAYTYKQRFDLVNHYWGTRRFHHDFAARLSLLRQQQAAGRREVLVLPRVNMPPGVLRFTELHRDPEKNQLFARAYGLGFPVRLED